MEHCSRPYRAAITPTQTKARPAYFHKQAGHFYSRIKSIQEIPQFLAAAGVAELAQGLGFDLADALARDVELLADLFERAGTAVLDAEAQLQDFSSRGVRVESTSTSCSCSRVNDAARSARSHLVGDEVAKVAVFLFADRRFEGDGLLRDLQDLAHLVDGHVHLGGDLFGRGVVAELLQELTGHADDLVDGLDHMNGDTMVRAWSAMARVMA